MKRIGLVLWAAGWGYLLLIGSLPRLPIPPSWLPVFAAVSFLAAWGRVAEWAYLAGAIWPVFFPAHAPQIVVGTLSGGVLLQFAAWTGQHIFRLGEIYERRRDYRDQWRYDFEEEPHFTRAGAPLNLAAWRRLTPEAFEEEALALFHAHGYAGELTSLSSDEGIDLALRRSGEVAVAQCKRYLNPVGQPPLRDFAGAMRAAGADVGYFITTSGFSDPARRWADALDEPRIILVDGPALVRWAQDGVMPG